ncbi:MAG: arylesterase [Rhizobiaceae bacterium]|nr:arylesterase [Rhizobiaceae bacterium]
MIFNSIAREIVVRSVGWLVIVFGIWAAMISVAQSEQPKTIVVLGDSLSAGFGLAQNEAFPEQLSLVLKEKGLNININNAGVSGDTNISGLARLDWSVGEGTHAVILQLGANDAMRGIPPQVTEKNLTTIVEKLQQRGIEVLLAGMKAPPNMGNVYVEEFDGLYPNLASKYNLVFYPFFLDGVAAEIELNQADRIHPTAKGIKLMVSRFLPSAITLIERLENK